MIRALEIPNLQGQSVAAPQVSAQAATAPARGLGDVAAGIARLGEPFAEMAERTQRAENARLELETRSGWNRQLADLNLQLQKEDDPAQFTQRTDALLSQLKGGIDPSLPPVVRDRLTLEYLEFADRAMISAGAEAARLSQKRTRLAVENDALLAAETGNRDLYMKTRETASEIMLPEEITRMDREFTSRDLYQQLAKRIEAEPATMESWLEDTESPEARAAVEQLGPENLDRLRRHAHQAANKERAELWDGLLNQALNDGPDRVILSKDELRRLSEEGSITPEQRASYLNAYHSETPPPFDPHLYNEAFGTIAQYDPANDPTGSTLAQLRGSLATLPLPRESVAELRDRLNERANPQNPTTHKLSGDFAKLTDESFNAGRFGNWFSYTDHDDDPRTIEKKVIEPRDYGRALATKRRFTDSWDAYLRNQGEDLDPLKAQETYDQLFERIVLDQDDPAAAPLIPAAPPSLDFGQDVDRLLGTPAPDTGKETSSNTTAPATFGGQRIQAPGTFYRNARPTIFGGNNDPADNGLSAFGGTTGEGGKEGVAIPLDVLKATFPGKDKAWFAANVRAVVKTEDGRQAVLPVADLGTAEWVWKRDGRPVLDLTPGAVKALGGRPIYKDGKLAGVANLGSLSFALTTDNAGTEADLRGMSWSDAQDAWFKDKKPTSADQIASGLAALKSAWLDAQAEDLDPGPWGDGTGGSVLPPIPAE